MESWLSRSSDWVPLAYFATIFGLYLVSELPKSHLGSESPVWPSVRSGQGPQSHLPGPQGSFSNAGSNWLLAGPSLFDFLVGFDLSKGRKRVALHHTHLAFQSPLSQLLCRHYRAWEQTLFHRQLSDCPSSVIFSSTLWLIDYTVCRNQVCTDERLRPPGIYLS